MNTFKLNVNYLAFSIGHANKSINHFKTCSIIVSLIRYFNEPREQLENHKYISYIEKNLRPQIIFIVFDYTRF